jgi:hypothetical protein
MWFWCDDEMVSIRVRKERRGTISQAIDACQKTIKAQAEVFSFKMDGSKI